MADRTYRARGVVLKKTKLGESDLIVTLLAEDGSALKLVAKGARKPQSPFSSRLELCSVVDAFIAKGRGSLGIAREVRLVSGNAGLRGDIDRIASASLAAELAERIAQEELAVPRLFDMTCAVFERMGAADAGAARTLAAAYLLKALSISGFAPSLRVCVGCGAALPDAAGMVRFSLVDGGYVCGECGRAIESVRVAARTLALAEFLLYSTFEEVSAARPDEREVADVLQLCRRWIEVHIGANLRSFPFALASAQPRP
ncbi:hypothetical protein JI75_04015 [Berryella intestinalis]|uniref:DNA repair protein RecO n=1 Tax=Berryella intestinalis TaxID=1531429 RepID=A0A0A8B9Y6_9ACTN|nr:DNA repair protein RecO [Berryella intestinalis]AJC11957.1 hypothetical protein JI75_04015 [Berryella intestinalis]